MDNNTNLLGVLRTLFQWKGAIVIICGLTFIGACGISLLLPNYFKATTVFFAASEDLAKPESLFSERGSGIKTQYYGNENDIDRLITVAQSNELKDFLIQEFALYKHYKIDSLASKAKYKVRKKLGKYYELNKTERDAIELSFEDKDPAFAAQVANMARIKIEDIAIQLIRANQKKGLDANRDNVTDKQQQLDLLADSLAHLRKVYGIFNALTQTESMTTELSKAKRLYVKEQGRLEKLKSIQGIKRDTIRLLEGKVEGLSISLDTLEAELEHIRNGLAPVLNIEKQYFDLAQTLSEDRERTRVLEATYGADIPAVIVVETAETPLYKSRPRRSILVLAATFIVFCFMVLGVLLFESYKDVDWQSIINGESTKK